MENSKKISIPVVAIVLIIIAIVVVAVIAIKVTSGNSKSNLKISTTEDMEKLITQMYEGINDLPALATTVVDVSDKNSVTYLTGLTSNEKIDAMVISEPMMSSQAYSLVLVKVKSEKDADSIAKEMNEKIDARKWICVAADKVYSTSSGDIVCLVMSSEEWAKPVYDSFKKKAGSVGKEYVRETNEGFSDDYLDGYQQVDTNY